MTKVFLALVLLAALPTISLAAGLQLSIQDGRVSIDAQEVTVRQILTEWARVGKTRIVNAERVSGGPITIKFDGVPEKQALEIVLRNVPGYMASPRVTRIANASVYETIMIMATTTAVAAVRPPGAPFGGPQGRSGLNVTQLQQAPPLPTVSPEPEDPAADQMDDPAIAAAAAAGLVTVPAPLPGGGAAPSGPIAAPGMQPPAPAGNKPSTSNPWNAPVGPSQPTLAPPPAPAPAQMQPIQRPRPPQADR
jgi:hypothetical protein